MTTTAAENNLIQGRTGTWEVVIGIEVHAQVISKSKLFSTAATSFGAEPNTQVSLVDAAMPGMLPVLNRFCVEQAIRTGFGLNAEINLFSVFDRKNYFYPDLPAGYQISQFHHPIVGEGWVMIDLPNGTDKKIEIERLHLEQDAGKSLHDQHPHDSYIDLNRCGVGLMEIVSKPDLRSSEEATLYLKKLRSILRYLETCDCNMEQGSLRADVNVSVRHPGESLGTRCEIKNVNSIRFVQQAIDYEAQRQIEVIEDGGTVDQHTMLFDPSTNTTRPMRSKEEAHDYRYFPDPDLLPLVLHEDEVHNIQVSLPELPDAKKHRFMDDYGLNASDCELLVAEREVADFFEIVTQERDAKTVANWIVGPVFAALHKAGLHIVQSPVSTDQLGELLDLVEEGTLSGRLAKEVFEIMWDTNKTPAEIVEEKGLKQISDTGSLEKAVQEVLQENASMVADYKAGKEKLFGFFVGQVMKKTQGKANPGIVNEILKKALKE